MFIVTGGAGFIGSILVKKLEEQYPDSKIVVFDALGCDEKWQNLAKRKMWDIVNIPDTLPFLDAHAKEIKAIFHLGAISTTTEKDGDALMAMNFHPSIRLWNFCTQHKIPFFYASSAATYGDGLEGFSDENTLSNLERFRPLNGYAWSKHIVDLRVLRMIKENHCPPQWVGFKFFNVYGPNEYHKGGQKSVIAGIYPQILEKNFVRLFKSTDPQYEDGGQLRDFIWVEDCVDVILWFYNNPQYSGIFNVGTGKARSFNDLAKAVFAALHKTPKIEYFDMPETLRPKYQNFTEADMSRLRKIGYNKPFTSLEDGVRIYVQEYLSQDDPYA